MARQLSIVKFKGKMDGISFYEREGVAIARKASGPSKEKIMTHPDFQRTRENLSEFGALALGVSTLLKTFARVKNMRDNFLRSRLSKVLRKIMKYDVESLRGQRALEISRYRKHLAGLELKAGQKLDSVFSGAAVTAHSADRTSGTITLANVTTSDLPVIPFSASHFRLIQFLAVAPDIVYDAEQKSYRLASPGLEKAANLTFSDYYPVRGSGEFDVALETALTLPQGATLTDDTSVLQCLGIIFFEKIGPVYYPVKENVAMQVVDVF